MVEHAWLAVTSGGKEGALVVRERRHAEPLHEASSPGTLLACSLVARTGHNVYEHAVGLKARGIVEAGAYDNILIWEGQGRPSELLGHYRTQDGVTLAYTTNRGKPDDHTRGAADALKGAEGEALQVPPLTGGGHQYPFLGLL